MTSFQALHLGKSLIRWQYVEHLALHLLDGVRQELHVLLPTQLGRTKTIVHTTGSACSGGERGKKWTRGGQERERERRQLG